MQYMQSLSQKVVIIGAGIVGVNLADELASLGWTDITVVEQGPLTMPGGSTSHAPGLVFQTNSSKTMTQLARYTVEKFLSLDNDGENCFDQIGGLEVATTPERLEDLKRKSGWASSWGIEAYLVTPAECIRLYPFLNPDVVLGGLHIPSDGLAKAARAVQLLISRTSRAGVRYLGSTPVTGIERDQQRVHGVTTPRGIIPADIVVSCAGFWGAEVGKMIDLPIPLLPLAHQYVQTSVVPGLLRGKAASTVTSMPILRHQDADLYYREHGDRYGIGFYGHRPLPVDAASLGVTPKDVDEQNQPSRLPFTRQDFKPAWRQSCTLLPTLKETDISDSFNGIFSFTPDGAPIVGRAPNIDGFFVAEAIWVTHSAGVARAVAQLLTTGCSDIDMTECQLSRFENVQLSPEYVSETSQQNFIEVYDIIHPRQPKSSPRNLRVSPFYVRQRELDAFFVDTKAWERPEWYEANVQLIEQMPPRWRPVKRDAWSGRFYSSAVAVEAWKARTAVAVFDLTSTTRLKVSGPGAFDLLQCLCSRDISTRPGTIQYALLLGYDGCIRGDVTIARLAEDLFHLSITSNVVTELVSLEARSLSRQSPHKWVQVHDISSGTCCMGLWGPKSRNVMRNLGFGILGNDLPPDAQCKHVRLAGIPVLAMRSSDIGEPGWEIHTSADYGQRLWDAVWQAGESEGLVAAGRVALVALRLEKGYRVFGSDYTAEHDPIEAGVEFAVDSGKRACIGLEAFQLRKKRLPVRALKWLSINDCASIVMGKEPIFSEGNFVGYVANAAFGYAVGKPIAHAWLDATIAEGDTVAIEYFGRMIQATVSKARPSSTGLSSSIPSRL